MRIQVLGPFCVRGEHGELGVRDLHGVKPKQVLQLLVIERGHTVPKERLAELLWQGAMPRNHAATLETYVSVLRHALEPEATPRTSVILTERGGYRLDTDRVEVDLDEFDRALETAALAEAHSALDALKRGLSLVRGVVLEDEPYADWAQATREIYTQRHVTALIDAGRLSLLTGDAPGALAMAERAVTLNPLAEGGYQVLMTAAYALWRQDVALAAFDRCRRLLADELGVDPLDETVALYLSILRHEDVAELLPRTDEAPRPVASPDHLPLLNRDRELEQLRSAAARALAGTFTIALITGATGVGKTRLVETLAAELDVPLAGNRCSDLESGFPYLALSMALREGLPDLAAHGLPGLESLLQRAERGEPIDQFARLRVMESLASALPGRPAFLLLLDDVQWADPETITTLGYLQRRCPQAKVLVVLTYNPVAAPFQPLRALRPDVRVDVQELSRETVEGLGGPELYAEAGGNPAYIADWLDARARGLDEPFTAALRERVVTACWDLGPAAFRLLCAASAVDQPTFSCELLAHLVNGSPIDVAEQLDRLFEKELLAVVSNEFAFRSPAVRSVLLCTLTPARRERLQQAAAKYGLTGPGRRASDQSPGHGPRWSAPAGRAGELEPPLTVHLEPSAPLQTAPSARWLGLPSAATPAGDSAGLLGAGRTGQSTSTCI
jgi:DNA-binding SARP family transcriptional activator